MFSFIKNKTKKLSIVIIFYNVKSYVKECLDSIVSQGIDKEIICVDDCSTDGTYEILTEYERQYEDIKVYRHKENLGGAAARYTGMINSCGEYLLFVDGDDRLIENSLNSLYDEAKSTQVDILEFSMETDGNQRMFNGNLKRENSKIDSNLLEAYDQKKILNTLANKLISKKVYKKAMKKINTDVYHDNYSAVIYFLYHFLIHAENLMTTETVGYFYYDNRGMTATMNWLERCKSFCNFDITYRELLEVYGYTKTLKNIYKIICNQAIGTFLNLSDKEQEQNKELLYKLMTEEEVEYLISEHLKYRLGDVH